MASYIIVKYMDNRAKKGDRPRFSRGWDSADRRRRDRQHFGDRIESHSFDRARQLCHASRWYGAFVGLGIA